MNLQVITATLGAGNEGNLGPQPDANPAELDAVAAAAANPVYEKPVTTKWVCLDGRPYLNEQSTAEGFANPAIGGGIAITETAADFMLNESPAPLSQTIAQKTMANIRAGQKVEVHGADDNKAGCAANADMRPVLKYAAANIDIIVPTVIDLMQRLPAETGVASEDVTAMIVRGKRAADNDALWDVKPDEVPDIVVANGGSYEPLTGSHGEVRTRIDLTEGAFDKAAFLKDMQAQGLDAQIFPVALGAYAKTVMERSQLQGLSARQAGLQIAAAFAYNVALAKHLSNGDMPADLVS